MSTTTFWIQDVTLLLTGISNVDSFIPKKGQTFAQNINAFTRTLLLLLVALFFFGRFLKFGGNRCLISLPKTLRVTVSILLGLGLISLISMMSEGYLYASPSLPGAQFKADKNQTLFSGKTYEEPYYEPPHYRTKQQQKYRDSKFMFLEPEAEGRNTENFQSVDKPAFRGEPQNHRDQNYASASDTTALLQRYKNVREPYPRPSGGNGNPSIAEGDEMSRIGSRVAHNRVTAPRTIDASNWTYNERGIKYRPYRYQSDPWYKK